MFRSVKKKICPTFTQEKNNELYVLRATIPHTFIRLVGENGSMNDIAHESGRAVNGHVMVGRDREM